MCAHQVAEPRPTGSRIAALLTWVGGGERRELGERHERSAHAIAGVVVILNAALAWLVTTLAVTEAARWPVLAIMPFTLVFGLLVGCDHPRDRERAGPRAARRRGTWIGGRSAVGLIVGEFAALALFSGTIDRHLEQQAAGNADSVPAVVQASNRLAQVRDARVALDKAVDSARIQRDEALVVARCEYHPSPTCPQTRITGVPGSGPETRTANQILADTQRELDTAVGARDAPSSPAGRANQRRRAGSGPGTPNRRLQTPIAGWARDGSPCRTDDRQRRRADAAAPHNRVLHIA